MFQNFTAASYCPVNENTIATPAIVSCTSDVCPLVEADNATLVAEFGTYVPSHLSSTFLKTSRNASTLADIKGFVATDHARSLIIVAFAGSGATIRNWIDDFVFLQSPYSLCPLCLVHDGFITGWNERRVVVMESVVEALAVYTNYSLVITGHSIGAAIATLAGAEFRSLNYSADVYTYGSPRVGNAAFASFVTAQAPDFGNNYRVTHYNAPVPQIPPELLDYEHTSPEYWLASGPDTRNDYELQDIIVCEGIGNSSCNEGTGLIPIDGTSHNHYLGEIDVCAGSVEWK